MIHAILALFLAVGDVPAAPRHPAAHSLDAEHVVRDRAIRSRARTDKRRVKAQPPDAATLLSRGIAP